MAARREIQRASLIKNPIRWRLSVPCAWELNMNKMKFVILSFLFILFSTSVFACPSTVTLNINSSNYSGRIDVEFRSGARPGSRLLKRDQVITSGSVVLPGVCAGTYFFAFSTPDSDQVSVTQHFEVINDGARYSTPVITVTYSRSLSSGQRVGTAKRSEL